MRATLATAFLLLASLALGPQFGMAGEISEGGLNRMDTGSSNDSGDYGPIQYTDEFQYAGIGPSNRSATLMMPGGHDYDLSLIHI